MVFFYTYGRFCLVVLRRSGGGFEFSSSAGFGADAVILKRSDDV